jgi:hypothetical protein
MKVIEVLLTKSDDKKGRQTPKYVPRRHLSDSNE